MAFTKPIISLGLDHYNPTMSIPSGSLDGLPAGWTASGSSVTPYGSSVADWIGHDRVQYFQVNAATTYTLVGSPCMVYGLCIEASTKILGALVAGISGGAAAGTTVALYIRWYRSGGIQVGSDTLVHSITGSQTLGLTSAEATITPPANAFSARSVIKITRTGAGTSYVSIAFASLGAWNGSTASYWQWARYAGSPGTSARKISQTETYRPLYGPQVTIDRTRYSKPYRLRMLTSNWTTAEKTYLERAWAFNTGMSVETNQAQNPSGGVWPILLLPGLPGAPPAMLCDFEQRDEFPLDVDPNWYADPPYWGGSFSLIERP